MPPLPWNQRVSLSVIRKGLSSGVEKRYWKAAADLGEYVEDSPEMIWDMVVEFGSHRKSDVRGAVATCVLEHILEHHFLGYFPKVVELIRSGNKEFRDCFVGCSKFGQAEEKKNSNRWDKLMADSKN